jgi:hypothetical protein
VLAKYTKIGARCQACCGWRQGCLVFRLPRPECAPIDFDTLRYSIRRSRRSHIEIKRAADERWFRYVATLVSIRASPYSTRRYSTGVHPKIKQPRGWRVHVRLAGKNEVFSEMISTNVQYACRGDACLRRPYCQRNTFGISQARVPEEMSESEGSTIF